MQNGPWKHLYTLDIAVISWQQFHTGVLPKRRGVIWSFVCNMRVRWRKSLYFVKYNVFSVLFDWFCISVYKWDSIILSITMQSSNFEALKPAYGNVVVRYKYVISHVHTLKVVLPFHWIFEQNVLVNQWSRKCIFQLVSLNRFIICESRKAIFLLTRLKEIIPCSEESTFFLS